MGLGEQKTSLQMGEQKTSLLRSDKMENIIFNGSKSRKKPNVVDTDGF